jgi:hypothetical protein
MPNLKSMASGDLTITLSRVGSFRAGRHGDAAMRKLLTFLIALGAVVFAVISPVSSTSVLMLAAPQSSSSCTPGTQATNFLARTSGLNTTETNAYCNLINGLVSDGIITGAMNGANSGSGACGSILDALYILATNNTTTAALNLCGTSYSLIPSSTAPTFAPDRGYTGNGTSSFLNTGFAPGVGSPNYTQNSASIGAYDLTSSTVVSSTATIIGASFNGQSYIQPLTTSSAMSADVNTTTFALGGPNTNRQGAWIVTRTSSSTISLYGPQGSSTPLNTVTTGDTSAAGPTTPVLFYILAIGGSGGGAGSKWTTDQISAAFIGGALTGTQAAAINNRINTYMKALGVNIY